MANIFAIVRYVLRFGMFFVTNVYALFAYVMWAFTLLPLRVLWPSLFWKIESIIFRGLQSFLIVWMGTGDYGGKMSVTFGDLTTGLSITTFYFQPSLFQCL